MDRHTTKAHGKIKLGLETSNKIVIQLEPVEIEKIVEGLWVNLRYLALTQV